MRQVARSARRKIAAIDLVATRDGEFVLLGEITPLPAASRVGLEILGERVRAALDGGRAVRFTLFADRDRIRFHRVESDGGLAPILELATPAILSHYAPEAAGPPIYKRYMVGLIRSWLTDFADARWEGNPPARRELDDAGLAEALRGARVEMEWRFPVR